jgi:hypothetical protein
MTGHILSHDDEAYLCWQCVGETFLRDLIRKQGKTKACSFCQNRRKAFHLEEVADIFEIAFQSHYKRTRTGPTDLEYAMIRHGISNDMWLRDGEPVLEAFKSAADISTEIAEAIREILEGRHGSRGDYEMQNETEFDSDSYYEESNASAGQWHGEWSNFETELKENSRYFSDKALDTLRRVFEGICDYRTIDGESVIVEAGPEKTIHALFRARAFHDREKLNKALEQPEVQIGPPPTRLATAGRMNPGGISVFYGALDLKTALAEVRPVVGCTVLTGRFGILRHLRLLDLASLTELRLAGSVFDPDYIRRLERAEFLGHLSATMVAPVMPDDEAFEYLPTQVVCDFLASQKELSLDGIIYKSVQAGYSAKNIVLFHHASRVKEIIVPEGADISVSCSQVSDDEDDVEYAVSVELPPEGAAPSKQPLSPHNITQQYENYIREMRRSSENRELTLNLDLDSLEVHEVHAVSFTTTEVKVNRHTFPRLVEREIPAEEQIDYSGLL